MTTTQQTLLIVFGSLAAIWPIRYLAVVIIERLMDFLTPDSPRYPHENAPLVTAIIPARDEQETLEHCLRTVCAQTYPRLEILVVDDRSTDGTAAIARRFAESDPRVRVLTITELPGGWTGKTHGLQAAASLAQGEWFWFIDSDTRHEPDSLSIVMEYARREGAAMASVLPEMRCESFWEEVVQPLAGVVLMQSFPLFLVNNDKSPLAFANGQYILIERAAYEAVGGHTSVKDKFVEDIYLASRVKDSGRPIRVAIAQGIGSTRMYTSLPALVRGWSRILYDATRRNPWRLAWKAIDPLIFSQPGHVALVAAVVMLLAGVGGPFAWWLLGISVAQHAFAILTFDRLYRLSFPNRRGVLWYPLAGLILDWIVFRAIRSCLTGQVVWRGTSYTRPLPVPSMIKPLKKAI
jgi:glycosyltransferase involved in cell wall biosynthesis